ncbi:hypothetical protein RB599_010074 [Gaeumannomyces hyphopodioides]
MLLSLRLAGPPVKVLPAGIPRRAFFKWAGLRGWNPPWKRNEPRGEESVEPPAKGHQMADASPARSAGSSPPGAPDPPQQKARPEPSYLEVERSPHHQRGLAAAKLLSRRAALSTRDPTDGADISTRSSLIGASLPHRPKKSRTPDTASDCGLDGSQTNLAPDYNIIYEDGPNLDTPAGHPHLPGTQHAVLSDVSTTASNTPHRVATTAERLAQPTRSQIYISALQDKPQDSEDPGHPLGESQPKVTLSSEQNKLLDLLLSGRNVFYTGPAGCGKSTVLKAFVKELGERGRRVHVVAPTGIAALNVGGTTTWSYIGWKPDDNRRPLYELKPKTRSQRRVRRRLEETDVLIIDEISMVDSNHFYRLGECLKYVRGIGGENKPFGGVQVVVTGDFLQLPPVNPFEHCPECGRNLKPNDDEDMFTCPADSEDEDGQDQHQKPCPKRRTYFEVDKWAFRSSTWKECDFAHVQLNTVHRQKDARFLGILEKCRLGSPMNHAEMGLLQNHPSCTENAVELYCTNKEVDSINQRNYNRLQTKEYTYTCVDKIYGLNPSSKRHRKLLHLTRLDVEMGNENHETLYAHRDHRYDKKVYLKEGMVVCLLVNLNIKEGLVNGSQGVICGFEEEIITASTPPAAMPDNNIIDTTPFWGDQEKVRAREIRLFAEQMEKQSWPVVQFHNGRKCTIIPDCIISEMGPHSCPHEVFLCRTQIPLMPAWAMTVHKSQGMTLDSVVVNMDRAFAEGQVYVALSRVRTLEGLKVEGDINSLRMGTTANQEAKHFYNMVFGTGKGE